MPTHGTWAHESPSWTRLIKHTQSAIVIALFFSFSRPSFVQLPSQSFTRSTAPQAHHRCHDACLLPLDPCPLDPPRPGGLPGRSFASSHAFPFPHSQHRFEVLLLCVGRRSQVLVDATKHLRGERRLPRTGEAPPVSASVRFHSSSLPLCTSKGDQSSSLASPSSPLPSSFRTPAPSFLLPLPALLLLLLQLLVPSTTALACSVWSAMQPASVVVVLSCLGLMWGFSTGGILAPFCQVHPRHPFSASALPRISLVWDGSTPIDTSLPLRSKYHPRKSLDDILITIGVLPTNHPEIPIRTIETSPWEIFVFLTKVNRDRSPGRSPGDFSVEASISLRPRYSLSPPHKTQGEGPGTGPPRSPGDRPLLEIPLPGSRKQNLFAGSATWLRPRALGSLPRDPRYRTQQNQAVIPNTRGLPYFLLGPAG